MVAAGASEDEARRNFCLVDQFGAIGIGRKDIATAQIPFAQPAIKDGSTILETVQTFKPTILLGLSGIANLFTEDVVRALASHSEKPVVFPLSNPISKSECTAEQAFAWTDGRAVFASGSPFDDVDLGDGRVGLTSQCNNFYSFPGMGLAVTVLRISRVTDSMFHAAAVRISQLAGEEQLRAGRLFPPVEDLRSVSAEVAASVARIAIEEELTTADVPDFALQSHENMVRFMRTAMWEPEYATLVAD
jgi:malic enzyme